MYGAEVLLYIQSFINSGIQMLLLEMHIQTHTAQCNLINTTFIIVVGGGGGSVVVAAAAVVIVLVVHDSGSFEQDVQYQGR
jgi:hypothetical protein